MASYGWDSAEFVCLVGLWNAESGWSWSATNPSSGAYGIPQSLPGWKMASAGSDWLTNPATQITWGMNYIRSVYGSPCKAYDRFLLPVAALVLTAPRPLRPDRRRPGHWDAVR